MRSAKEIVVEFCKFERVEKSLLREVYASVGNKRKQRRGSGDIKRKEEEGGNGFLVEIHLYGLRSSQSFLVLLKGSEGD